MRVLLCLCPHEVLLFSCPWSEGWPHHGHTFSIYLCPLSYWLTLPQAVLSTYWCCPPTPCVVFLACMHLALFLVLSPSPGSTLVSSWCDHSMLASLLWQLLTLPSLLQLCQECTHLFFYYVHIGHTPKLTYLSLTCQLSFSKTEKVTGLIFDRYTTDLGNNVFNFWSDLKFGPVVSLQAYARRATH